MIKNTVLLILSLLTSLMFIKSALAQEFLMDPTESFDHSIQNTIQAPMDDVIDRPARYPVENHIQDDYQSVIDDSDDHRYDSYYDDENDGSTSF